MYQYLTPVLHMKSMYFSTLCSDRTPLFCTGILYLLGKHHMHDEIDPSFHYGTDQVRAGINWIRDFFLFVYHFQTGTNAEFGIQTQDLVKFQSTSSIIYVQSYKHVKAILFNNQ